jgi:hypothetical protein
MRTSRPEITGISRRGLEIRVGGEGKFLSFKAFPWFLDASVGELLDVEMPGPGHLYWPTLDVDIAVDSIDHPERFPLVSGRGRGRRALRSKSKVAPRLPNR